MRITLLLYFYVLFLFFGIFMDAEARVYKCNDSNGKVVYMNAPCPENQKGEIIIHTERSGTEYKNDYYYENEIYKEVIDIDNIKKISSGERVNIDRYVAKNKITAFLFYADWCHACEKVRPQVEEIAITSDNFVLRKIDITQFDSPVTEQYGIRSIPYFMVYDESGDLAAKGSTNSIFKYLNGKI